MNLASKCARDITLQDVAVDKFELPDSVLVSRELGFGSNNRVYAARWEPEEGEEEGEEEPEEGEEEEPEEEEGEEADLPSRRCVLRVPRRRSDTQQKGSALWELRHTLRASELRVGPTVLGAWFAKHANGRHPSGLYLLAARGDTDLDDLLMQGAEEEEQQEVGRSLVRCLEVLAREELFAFDLKPSNVILAQKEEPEEEEGEPASKRQRRDGRWDVWVADYGRDFCEWGKTGAEDRRTPNIDFLRRIVQRSKLPLEEAKEEDLVHHILFATMLVILSATTTSILAHEKRHHRMGSEERQKVHPLAEHCRTFLDSMQGRHVALLRKMLRQDDVRGVLRHYNGRRNSGTKRTLELARGKECL